MLASTFRFAFAGRFAFPAPGTLSLEVGRQAMHWLSIVHQADINDEVVSQQAVTTACQFSDRHLPGTG
jgi:hypothetical protein